MSKLVFPTPPKRAAKLLMLHPSRSEILAFRNIKHGGRWDFPGGKEEDADDDSLLQTLRREVREELVFSEDTRLQIETVDRLVDRCVEMTSYSFTPLGSEIEWWVQYFLVWLDDPLFSAISDVSLRPSEASLSSLRWMSVESICADWRSSMAHAAYCDHDIRLMTKALRGTTHPYTDSDADKTR